MIQNKKIKKHYLHTIVICHGLSECIFMSFLRTSIKRDIEILSKDKGKSSIQLTSSKQFIVKQNLNKISGLLNKYKDRLEIKDKKIINLKIFIVVDVDEKELTDKLIEDFKSGLMFKEFETNEYIVPIFNDKNLDDVLIKLGYDIDPRNKSITYSKVFNKSKGSLEAYKELEDKLNKFDKSNMYLLFEHIDKFDLDD